jgi:hypothetical protein
MKKKAKAKQRPHWSKKRKRIVFAYTFELSNTWRTTIDAHTRREAEDILKANGLDGYDKADEYDGLTMRFMDRRV